MVWRFCCSLTLLFAGLTLAGCFSPLVGEAGFTGVGFFESEQSVLRPGVEARRVEGFGVGFVDGQMCLGYMKHQVLIAALGGESYALAVPAYWSPFDGEMFLWVGGAAEEAASDAAILRFLRGSNGVMP